MLASGNREHSSHDLGILWEHLVLNELHGFLNPRWIHYWRSKNGNEVDLVIARGVNPPIAIECKWSADEFDPRHVKAFRSRYAEGLNLVISADVDHDLLWKWWSKDSIGVQSIHVELVDILHFLVSAMIASGLTADKVLDLYQQKHAVNKARQETGYSKATKTEEDNRSIQ